MKHKSAPWIALLAICSALAFLVGRETTRVVVNVTQATKAPPETSSAAPAALPVEVASASLKQPAPESAPIWEEVPPDAWSTITGDWIGAVHGDAVSGGKLVQGGARVSIVQDRPGSKTPWNVHFMVPTAGHATSTTASGGCGFYPSGKGYCRGYGEPDDAPAVQRDVTFTRAGDRLRLFVSEAFEVELRRP